MICRGVIYEISKEVTQLEALLDSLKNLIGIAIGAGGFVFIQFLITRRDDKADKLGKLMNELNALQKDMLRVQLLVLMKDYPERKDEIIDKVGRKYFIELNGDWYMSQLFDNYLVNAMVARPAWFDGVVSNE